jgi:hypothetical protein
LALTRLFFARSLGCVFLLVFYHTLTSYTFNDVAFLRKEKLQVHLLAQVSLVAVSSIVAFFAFGMRSTNSVRLVTATVCGRGGAAWATELAA